RDAQAVHYYLSPVTHSFRRNRVRVVPHLPIRTHDLARAGRNARTTRTGRTLPWIFVQAAASMSGWRRDPAGAKRVIFWPTAWVMSAAGMPVPGRWVVRSSRLRVSPG